MSDGKTSMGRESLPGVEEEVDSEVAEVRVEVRVEE